MSAATDIARMRRELSERLAAHDQQQLHLLRTLKAIEGLGRRSLGNTDDDLAELIARVGEFRGKMRASFAAESEALFWVENAVRGIRARAR